VPTKAQHSIANKGYGLKYICFKYKIDWLLYIFFRYEGLSDKFLSCPIPKLLLLAGTDRLDRFNSKPASNSL